MASTTSSFPGQQQPDSGAAGVLGQPSDPQVVASTSGGDAWHGSGSIGPFFGVISVLAILAFLSCFLGRICTRNGEVLVTPLHNIGYDKGFLGWVKRKWRWSCKDSDVEVADGSKGDKERDQV